jgi:uncharacterized protein YmfQ (DUF2313 family)
MTEIRDRHVTRTGEDYAVALRGLLPQGQAWPRDEESALVKVIKGLTRIWEDFELRASHLLEQESDPRFTVELLPDWERAWGLPDPCYEAPQTIAERQLALIMRMTVLGSQSRAFFIGIAAQLGYTITISEYRTFVVGIDRVGDNRSFGDGSAPMRDEWYQPIYDTVGNYVAEGALSTWPCYGLGPATNRFYWTVHVAEAKLIWFRCASGQTGVDPHLRVGIADDLECLIERLKPAHTEVIFDYSGLSSPGDPMAGTP